MRSFQSFLPSETLPLFTLYFFPLIITRSFLLFPDLTASKWHALGRDSCLVHYSEQLLPALGLPSGVTRCLCQAFCCTVFQCFSPFHPSLDSSCSVPWTSPSISVQPWPQSTSSTLHLWAWYILLTALRQCKVLTGLWACIFLRHGQPSHSPNIRESRQLFVSQESIGPFVPSVTLALICSLRKLWKDSDTASATVFPGLTSWWVQGHEEWNTASSNYFVVHRVWGFLIKAILAKEGVSQWIQMQKACMQEVGKKG